MAKMSLKKRIVLSLATFLDEAGEWIEVLGSPYWRLDIGGYKKQSIYNAISALLRTGYLEKKIKKNGEVVFRITSQGKTKIVFDVPLARFSGKKWDGIWRLVSFDVPEKRARLRKWLRSKLKELGFGMLQESLWIIPHNLEEAFEEFLKQGELKDFVIVWEGRRIFGEDEREVARRVWNLDGLHGSYLDFILKYEKLLSDEEEIKKRKKEWEEEYFSLILKDPGLPRELLPNDWLFERARQLFKELIRRS